MELEAETAAVGTRVTADFDAFFRRHFPGVARAAALVARDAGVGQDAAQESFARLFVRWSEMTSEDHARNFAYRVAMNLARSHVRSLGRISLFGLALRRETSVAPDPADLSIAWMDVVRALGGLSPRQRSCVVLVDYADLDAMTVGSILGMRAGTVRVHLMRGRRALRERLGLDAKEAT